MNICSVDDCQSPSKHLGWCSRHYRRNYTYGSPTAVVPKRSAEDRFWAKVDKSGGEDSCWLWTAGKIRGYGAFYNEGKMHYAHRVSSGIKGMVDHICQNPPCVNPAHLREVTSKQNAENSSRLLGKTGYRGVTWNKKSNNYSAHVGHFGKVYKLGRYSTAREAAEVALRKRLELFTHNNQDHILASEWGIPIPEVDTGSEPQ